jgi:AcrR family transcriptional regulator
LIDEPTTTDAGPGRRGWVGVDPDQDGARPLPLSRPRIVRAALRLVDDRGLAALTMRALATALEVSTMALYNHVKDKDELVDLMVDLMLGEVDCSEQDGDWTAQLRALVCSYHHALSAHHHLARVYSARVSIGPHGLRIMERAIGLLLGAGLQPRDATDAFFSLYTYTVGFHQMGSAQPLPIPLQGAGAGDPRALPIEETPAIAAVDGHLNGTHQPGRFEYGLDLLLYGLRTKISAPDEVR